MLFLSLAFFWFSIFATCSIKVKNGKLMFRQKALLVVFSSFQASQPSSSQTMQTLQSGEVSQKKLSIFNQSGNHLWIITNHLIIKSSVWKNVSDICDDNIKIATNFSRYCCHTPPPPYPCVIYFIYLRKLDAFNESQQQHVCVKDWFSTRSWFFICSAYLNSSICRNGFSISTPE
jgi:hypothetical protein